MEIQIGVQKFELSKVNIKMRNQYAKMTDLASELTFLAEEAEAIADEEIIGGNPGSGIEGAKSRQRVRQKLKEIDERRKYLAQEITNARDNLLISILAKNGYDYDKEFWEEEADIEDLNNIVLGMFRGASSGK